jgi:molybdopterin converting factor small subunit
MSITVDYLGILAEKTGIASEVFEKAVSKKQLLDRIMDKHPELEGMNFVVSCNGVIVHEEESIKSGDNIVLLPPAPGG